MPCWSKAVLPFRCSALCQEYAYGLHVGMLLIAGLLFMDHPKRPRTSMLKPVLQSAVSTVRIIDNLTDMSLIRIVLAQVCFYSDFGP